MEQLSYIREKSNNFLYSHDYKYVKLLILSEVFDKQWINKVIRVAGIVTNLDISECSFVLQYELNKLVVNITRDLECFGHDIDDGKTVEVIGELKETNNGELILEAKIIRVTEGMNIHYHHMSILLRRKLFIKNDI
ncbi:hypothetical protein cand_021210 [Cryptosporidium andersoni]|uniref:OB-fold nucleic acid binding domain-containing protein n=1 Tax=Cryptosporidium andersoni TaxID=117008 RepID=A0A1J4MUP4_9CRYT|nr:hypothetical protein cand_021210 [Cryptosporidium andersoni]